MAAAGAGPVNLKDSKKQVARPLHPRDDHPRTPSNRSVCASRPLSLPG